MLCGSAERPPEGPEWRYELKLDGFRAIGRKSGRSAQLWSRNQKDFTRRFPDVSTELRRVLLPHFEELPMARCPFVNLPDGAEGRWGEGLTAAKMRFAASSIRSSSPASSFWNGLQRLDCVTLDSMAFGQIKMPARWCEKAAPIRRQPLAATRSWRASIRNLHSVINSVEVLAAVERLSHRRSVRA
jgi:ATP dependent DNA ligase domain